MKLVVIDGMGGGMGAQLVEAVRKTQAEVFIFAVGTNTAATAAMLRAGADSGATGENPVIVNCRDADIIAGPIGIIIADSLGGEITPSMAHAVGASGAHKVLLPITKCSVYVAGVRELSSADYIMLARDEILHRLGFVN